MGHLWDMNHEVAGLRHGEQGKVVGTGAVLVILPVQKDTEWTPTHAQLKGQWSYPVLTGLAPTRYS